MLLDIDGALVIHEGVRRLRWRHQYGVTFGAAGQQPQPLRRIVDSVWPDRTAQAHLRRQIEHGQRLIVVFDDADPVVVVPTDCLPRVPTGSFVAKGPDAGSVTLWIPPFRWLSAADQVRGEDFSAHAQSIMRGIPGPARPPLLVEAGLVGTGEPLRFAFQSRPMTIDLLREVVRHLYTARTPTTLAAPGIEQSSIPLTWLLRSAAA